MSLLFSQEEVTKRYAYECRMEGHREGHKEANENTAISMLKDKMDIDKIAKYTQLTPKRIRELAKAL